jgi:hypothetical protein
MVCGRSFRIYVLRQVPVHQHLINPPFEIGQTTNALETARCKLCALLQTPRRHHAHSRSPSVTAILFTAYAKDAHGNRHILFSVPFLSDQTLFWLRRSTLLILRPRFLFARSRAGQPGSSAPERTIGFLHGFSINSKLTIFTGPTYLLMTHFLFPLSTYVRTASLGQQD